MYPFNNNNQSPYPNPNGPFGAPGATPYPAGFSGMPSADFSVNDQYGNSFGGGGGGYPNAPGGYPNQFQPNTYPPNPQYPSNPQYPPQQGGYPNPYQTNQQYPPQYPNQAPNAYPNQPPNAYPNQPPNAYPNQPPNAYPNQPPNAYPNQAPGQGGYVIPNVAQNQGNLYPNLSGQVPGAPTYTPGVATASASQYYQGTLKPAVPFNPNDDAEKLYKAMKGFGTNETVLIDILCRRSAQQRLQVASAYKTLYGKDLLRDVLSETSGNFEDILKALLTPTVQYEAAELKEAIDGAGTDEVALLDIICTKTNAQMIELRNFYKQMYRRDMEKEVRGDVSGYFQRILVSLLNGNRSEAPGDINRARQLAQELYKAGEKKLGTNEVTFNKIFAGESYEQLRMIFDEYYKLTGHDIEKAIKSEMSGDVESAFIAIAQIARNPPAYFAERLYKSMKGAGTFDRTLIRNIVLRSEIDMVQIKIEFQKRFSKTLESFIKGDASGDYRKALLCLIGDENWKKH